MIGGHIKSNGQHAACARARHRAVALIGDGGQAAIRTQFVSGGGQIGGAVDQRAVEVKEDGMRGEK